MVIDTSAIIAILGDEPERKSFIEAIDQDSERLFSAASLLEASIVILQRYGEDGLRDLDMLIGKAGIEIAPVDFEQSRIARFAYRNFGKSRHAANLNFGDCFAYALSKATAQPLLFKGRDFFETDVTPVKVDCHHI